MLILVVIIGAGIYLYFRPWPAPMPITQTPKPPKTTAIQLPWPSGGQAAIGATGYGLLASNGPADPKPIASIAKIITALAILQKKPLTGGGQGPTITLDTTDVGYYDYYLSHDGSVAQVTDGEQITEYQALEAMLIPSANNVADSMVRWAFGSTDNYLTYANQMVKEMGLSHTTVAGASGFADTTTSTAADLVQLGIAALNNPSITQIVSLSSADLPVAGTVNNVNWLLGSDGVVGIKTGNTDVAGGCFLFGAKHQVAGQTITIVGAILGQPQLNDAISAAQPLLGAVDSGFTKLTVIHKGQSLGYYATAWGATARAQAAEDLSLTVWKGQDTKVVNSIDSINAPAKAGSKAGTVVVQSGKQIATSPLNLSSNLSGPSWHWRLIRH